MFPKRRFSLLSPDGGAGGQGSRSEAAGSGGTTDTTASNTGGDPGTQTQAGGAGAGTDPATKSGGATGASSQTQDNQNQPQAQGQQQQQQDPKVAAALKALEDAGVTVYTQQQHNGHMTAARKKWEAEVETAKQQAAQEAERKTLEEQGKYKPLYEQAQGAIQTLEAKVKRYETALDAQITEATKSWPEKIRAKDPGSDDYERRLSWYEDFRELAEDIVKSQGQGRPSFGQDPQAYGANGRNLADDYISRTYAHTLGQGQAQK